MSRSRESRPRGSRKQQTKITYAARARTLNRFKKIIMGHRVLALLAHSLLIKIRATLHFILQDLYTTPETNK